MSSPPNNDNNSVVEEIDIKEIEHKCDTFIEEIMASPEEYTTKKNLEGYQMSLKEDLMKLLKKNDMFPVKLSTYQRGFSSKMDANCRLIVFEKDDETKCREYSAYRMYDQFCLQCRSISNHKVLLYSRYIHGILFVPVKHICAPKEFAAVMEIQEKLKDGDIKAALSLQRKYAVKKHPRYLFPKEKPRKCSKPVAKEKRDKPTKAPKKKKAAVVVDAIKVAEGDNNIDLHLNETIAKDAIDVVDPPAIGNHLLNITKSIDASSSPAAAILDGNEKSDGSLQPEQLEDHVDKASTSNIAALSGMEITETTVNDNNDTLKPEATSASSTDSQSLSSPLDPSEASSSSDARRGGRKRGSKNLLFAKNSLDLIDAIKSLLPPQQSFDENSAPKKRRRRRKASIQAAALEAVKTEGDENMDLIASSNATESILDMIDTELLNNEKYLSENSSTSDDNENTDDCEIIEENLYISLQNGDQIRNMRERTETITIEEE
uniref:Uncharacterized protein n=1 Tax=Panagrolaimus davidi TaxID=227884 RepID=A0A914QEX6_9BILA